MSGELPLSLVTGSYGHNEEALGRSRLPDGTRLERVVVEPLIGAYRRMIRTLEFDICELAPTSYMVARSRGVPITALPIFLSRSFHHGDIVCRGDAGVAEPGDLEGKRFGVRAYTVTTGVWARGLLADRGVDLSRIEWVVDDEDHILDLPLPPNVRPLPAGGSIAEAFETGDIQAALKGAAGVGRKGSPMQPWTESDVAVDDRHMYGPLFRQPERLAKSDFDATGVYPFHRTLVVKDETLDRMPQLPRMLFDLFNEAKELYLARLDNQGDTTDADQKYLDLSEIVGGDPLPYGFSANRTSIRKLGEYAAQQGIVPDDIDAERLFLELDPE